MRTRLFLLFLAALLMSHSLAVACPGLQGVALDGSNNLTITLNTGQQTITFTSLPAGSGANKAKTVEAALQQLFDVRQTLLSLSLDDPDKVTNPNRASLFWSVADGTAEPNPTKATHLTGRGCVVSVTWDGSKFVWTFTSP